VANADTTPPPALACTVRDCGQALTRVDASYRCDRGHAFDLARSGYVNLLQPQDRRSRHAGDSAAAVAARSRLLAAGIGAAAIAAIARLIGGREPRSRATIVDLGCGGGELLGGIADGAWISGIGLDLSTAAVDAAARRFPALTWVVANADRRLPLLDASVDAIVSLNGRRNPAEAARVLRPRGRLVVGVPAADDLIELREQVLGGRVERDRVDRVVDEHAARFDVEHRHAVRERRTLDRAALVDLLEGTYRGQRASHAGRIDAIDTLDVTSATDMISFVRRT
jgi:23S rRNA (guanine745-N1)-methyltransferase